MKKLKGEDAKPIIGDYVECANITLYTPIRDTISSGDKIGHLVFAENKQFVKTRGIYETKDLTEKQKEIGIKGSFIFIGNNPNIFSSLFNNVFTGKFYKDPNIIIDSAYIGLISFKFIKIIKQHLYGEIL